MQIAGELPRLAAPDMLKLAPLAAVPYVKHRLFRRCRLSDETIAKLIKRYREGASVRTIGAELRIDDETVKRWLHRAEEVHVLRVRRKLDDKVEKFEAGRIEAEQRMLHKKEEAIDADLALAQRLRMKIDLVLNALTPEKASRAKWKDLVDSLAKLVEKERLLTNKSTANTTQNVVQYIAHLSTMPIAERMRLAEATLVQRTLPESKPSRSEDVS